MSGHTLHPKVHRCVGVVQISGCGTDVWILSTGGTEVVQMCGVVTNVLQMFGSKRDVLQVCGCGTGVWVQNWERLVGLEKMCYRCVDVVQMCYRCMDIDVNTDA